MQEITGESPKMWGSSMVGFLKRNSGSPQKIIFHHGKSGGGKGVDHETVVSSDQMWVRIYGSEADLVMTVRKAVDESLRGPFAPKK